MVKGRFSEHDTLKPARTQPVKFKHDSLIVFQSISFVSFNEMILIEQETKNSNQKVTHLTHNQRTTIYCRNTEAIQPCNCRQCDQHLKLKY